MQMRRLLLAFIAIAITSQAITAHAIVTNTFHVYKMKSKEIFDWDYDGDDDDDDDYDNDKDKPETYYMVVEVDSQGRFVDGYFIEVYKDEGQKYYYYESFCSSDLKGPYYPTDKAAIGRVSIYGDIVFSGKQKNGLLLSAKGFLVDDCGEFQAESWTIKYDKKLSKETSEATDIDNALSKITAYLESRGYIVD